MNNQKTVLEEVVDSLVTKTVLMEKEILVKNEALLQKEQQTQDLLTSFEEKMFSNVTIETPKPDMSVVTTELRNGLDQINETLGKWSKPLKKEYHFSLFPDQVRSVEYVRAVLTRVILGFISLVFLILAYLLMDKHI